MEPFEFPRRTTAFESATETGKTLASRRLLEYRYDYRKLRTALSAYPDILWKSYTWNYCMNNTGLSIEMVMDLLSTMHKLG